MYSLITVFIMTDVIIWTVKSTLVIGDKDHNLTQKQHGLFIILFYFTISSFLCQKFDLKISKRYKKKSSSKSIFCMFLFFLLQRTNAKYFLIFLRHCCTFYAPPTHNSIPGIVN